MRKREQVVHDELEPCPYLEGRTARMPLRWQFRRVSALEFDRSLAQGDRRVGRMLYRTSCEGCSACEPIRIPVDAFRPSRSQRRVIKKNRDIRIELAPASFSTEKLALYNRHKSERGLSRSGTLMTRQGYEGWFVNSCTDTVEMRYSVDGRLIGIGIVDLGEQDSSSVYFFFDPDESKRSLGVFSVLMECAWLRKQGGRFHYLGLYVGDCRHLSYKAGYAPHERLIDGVWERFDGPPDSGGPG
jgi:arginine-tRNA-protein transferase